MPRTFCFAGRRSIRASLSARLPTPAAFATTLILHENFAIGSVTHRAHTPKDTTPPFDGKRQLLSSLFAMSLLELLTQQPPKPCREPVTGRSLFAILLSSFTASEPPCPIIRREPPRSGTSPAFRCSTRPAGHRSPPQPGVKKGQDAHKLRSGPRRSVRRTNPSWRNLGRSAKTDHPFLE